MINYQDSKAKYVQDVDEDVHILGVPVEGIITIIWGCCILIVASPLALAVWIFVTGFLFKKVRDAEKSGKSYFLRRGLLKFCNKNKIAKKTLPMGKITISEEEGYYE